MNSFGLKIQDWITGVDHRGRVQSIVYPCMLCAAFLLAAEPSAHGQFGSDRAPQANAPGGQQAKQRGNARMIQIVLREGTLVGPVRGRFVDRGHRWMFLVDRDSSSSADASKMLQGGVARKVITDTGSIFDREHAADGLADNASGTYADGSSFAKQTIGRANQYMDKRPTSLPPNAFNQMIVLENLMLGRVAAAIKLDPDDDVWTITARVTEFEEDNRLLLITAQRATKDH